jgi:hypothetical protein
LNRIKGLTTSTALKSHPQAGRATEYEDVALIVDQFAEL